MEDDIKVGIGIPCVNSGIHMQTAMSLIKTVSTFKHPLSIFFVNNTYLHIARKKLVFEAHERKMTHLFYVDSDMSFEGDTLGRLLAHKKDVIGVSYHQRMLPLTTTVRVKTPDGAHMMVAEIQDTLFECDAVATGCMLIDMKIFETIEKPWFFYKDDDVYPVGEDIWFCMQVKKAGFKIWCDPTIKVMHIGEYEY
jgi:choline kinase